MPASPSSQLLPPAAATAACRQPALPRPALQVERGSSEEGGSDDVDEDEDEDDEEGSDSGDGSPSHRSRKPRTKPFVAPPPRELPTRTTRGARMANQLTDEGDEDFWVRGAEQG